MEIQQAMSWVEPEQVLVIETIGTIDDFANAVRRVDGLEWMGELEVDEITPDDDFYDEEHPENELNGRLFLVMTNEQALQQLLSLWRRYKDDPEMDFEHGLKKFAYVFDRLKDIRRWGIQDRLLETGVLERWREELEEDGDGQVPFEAELWYRSSEQKRDDARRVLRELVGELGGQVVEQCTIPEIAYDAVLGRLPRNAVQEILDDPSTKLVQCENVMFFRPVGQMSSGKQEPEGEPAAYTPPAERPLPTEEPVVALLDGVPMANHRLLAGRLLLDDPDDWEASYAAADRRHGTAMASLIVHGDLAADEAPLRSQVYVRPIMKPAIAGFDPPLPERIPDNVLPVDLIHRAVKRMFEGDGETEPVAESVKVINLSIGDPSRMFDGAMTPLGRLLDWLAIEYDVLFVVSGGNSLRDIDVELSEADFTAMSAEEREAHVVKAILGEGRMRRILAPAESINAVTVGATHRDSSQIGHMSNVIDPFTRDLPSPISPLGTGYRRSVKPEIVYTGGRQLYRATMVGGDGKLKSVDHHAPPGCQVAYPGRQGQLNHTVHCAGTSNSAALVSRNAALCYEALQEVLGDHSPALTEGPHIIPMLKALLVHGASWGEVGQRLREIIEPENDGRQTRALLGRWLGYGIPDFSRAVECTEERATVLGFGELGDGDAHVYRLPLPPSLNARRDWRRLTVTLGWTSLARCSSQKYRQAGLWFEAEVDGLSASREEVDWRAVRRGTVQHEVFEGDRAVPLADGDALTIQVNCRKDAGKIEEPVPYGLVVSLEVAEGIDVAVYEEVRQRIAVPVEVQETSLRPRR